MHVYVSAAIMDEQRGTPELLRQALARFQNRRWAEASETIKLCLVRGDTNAAHHHLNRFAWACLEYRQPLQETDSVYELERFGGDMKWMSILDTAGYSRIAAVLRATDRDLLYGVPGFGLIYLGDLDQSLELGGMRRG